LGGDTQTNPALTKSLQQLKISAADAFGLNSEWGRWLRQQSVALKYNDVLLSNIFWSSADVAQFSDVESVASSLRLGLHTRYRRYSDRHVGALYTRLESDANVQENELNATPQNSARWRALQEQWQVKQWLIQPPTMQTASGIDGINAVKDEAWLWQNGRLQKIASANSGQH
jgi:hypothetical protein